MNELGSKDIDNEEDKVVENDEDTVVEDDDNGGDIDLTGEVNIESLVARLDATPEDDLEHKRQIKKRLEELHEAQAELESTYNFNLDDEL